MPVWLGAGAGLLTGAGSWLSGLGGQACIMRMAVAAVLFFMVGLFVRKSLREMIKDVENRRQEAEAAVAAEAARQKRRESEAETGEKGTIVDQRADERLETEAFQPGRVADFIRNELGRDSS